jgi:hypothetical protein
MSSTQYDGQSQQTSSMPAQPAPPAGGYGYGYPQYGPPPWAMHRPPRMFPLETKPFFLTSEFAVSLIAAIGIAITAASSDAFGAWRAWILITAIVVGYLVSRGIAKSGTKSNSWDPREELLAKARPNDGADGR